VQGHGILFFLTLKVLTFGSMFVQRTSYFLAISDSGDEISTRSHSCVLELFVPPLAFLEARQLVIFFVLLGGGSGQRLPAIPTSV